MGKTALVTPARLGKILQMEPLQTCFGWQDSRHSDDGTSMVCHSGTTRVTWMKAVFNHV